MTNKKTTVKKENWECFISQLGELSDIRWIGGQTLNGFEPFRMKKQITVCCHRKGLGIIDADADDNEISNFDFFKKCEEIFPKKEKAE